MIGSEHEVWTPSLLESALRAAGTSYHDRHPYHQWMLEGRLTPEQMRLWVANRAYYEQTIPRKDAALLSVCPVREVRRAWVSRILDHDGTGEAPGGIESWLRLAEAMGVTRDTIEREELLLPGVRDAVNSYVAFVRERPWTDGVASSVTELFAPPLLEDHLRALEHHYPWIDPEGLAYFRHRLTQTPKDARAALDIVLEHCRTWAQQQGAVSAVRFKCRVLWTQLDFLWSAARTGSIDGMDMVGPGSGK